MLYGTETKVLNQSVKRNIERFPEDFMFQLSKSELENLRTQIVATKHNENQTVDEWRSQFVTSNFTKMGLRRPPYAFTRNGIGMLSSVLRSETAVGEKVNQIITTIEERIPKQLPEQVFATGCVWDAWSFVSDLVRSAKMEVSPETVLQLLK